MRIAAAADLHCRVESGPELERMLRGVADGAEVLLLGGDLTNLGLPEEMEVLLAALGKVPEIYPSLGHTLLAEALERGGADVAVHGHAQHGSLAGRTAGGIPVLNASRYVVSRHTGRSYVTFDVTPSHAGLSVS